MSNNYYWRAVRRLAEKHGVSITKARRMDWEKEAERERKRRSEAHSTVRETRPKTKSVPDSKPDRRGIDSRTSGKPKTVKRKDKVLPKRIKPELKLKKYERIPTRRGGGTPYRGGGEEELFDESDFEGDDDYQEEWETDWEQDWPELDGLDDLDDFLDSIEYEDSDKYKEPS